MLVVRVRQGRADPLERGGAARGVEAPRAVALLPERSVTAWDLVFVVSYKIFFIFSGIGLLASLVKEYVGKAR